MIEEARELATRNIRVLRDEIVDLGPYAFHELSFDQAVENCIPVWRRRYGFEVMATIERIDMPVGDGRRPVPHRPGGRRQRRPPRGGRRGLDQPAHHQQRRRAARNRQRPRLRRRRPAGSQTTRATSVLRACASAPRCWTGCSTSRARIAARACSSGCRSRWSPVEPRYWARATRARDRRVRRGAGRTRLGERRGLRDLPGRRRAQDDARGLDGLRRECARRARRAAGDGGARRVQHDATSRRATATSAATSRCA